jgi:hypothetical protein
MSFGIWQILFIFNIMLICITFTLPEESFKPSKMESQQQIKLDVEDDADDEGEISFTEQLPHNGSESHLQINTERQQQSIIEQQYFRNNKQLQIIAEKQSKTRHHDVNVDKNLSEVYPLNIDSLCCSKIAVTNQPSDVKENCEVKATTDSETNFSHDTLASATFTNSKSEVSKRACIAQLLSHEENGEEQSSFNKCKQSESKETHQQKNTEDLSQKNRIPKSGAVGKVKLSSNVTYN